MRTTRLGLLTAVLMGVIAGPTTGEPKTGAAPAKPKDLCKDCVDPYNPVAERGRFFKAAGVDNELDATEFAADKARKGGFVRVFDSWTGMGAFDKNGNKTIDWFEADSYRRGFRKRALAAWDANGDGRLKGAERETANQALAAGKAPPASTGGRAKPLVTQGGQQYRLRMFDKNSDGKLDDDEKAAMAKWDADAATRRAEWARKSARYRELYQELIKKHDANGNGRIDADERKAYYDEYRERAKTIQWDKDGDGKLSDAERKEMETTQAEWAKRAEEQRRKWMLRRWDADKDGKMSKEETAAMEAHQAEMKARAEQYRKEYQAMRDKHDTDGDGQLNETERKAYYEAMRRRAQLRYWDKDADGQLSAEETAAMEDHQAKAKARAEQYRKEQAELRKKHDADGDGQLNAEERKGYYEEMRQRWQLRRWDKNSDGKLDEAERKTMETERAGWRQPRGAVVGPGAGGVAPRAKIIRRGQ